MIFMYEWRYWYQIMMHNPFLLCNTECIIVYLLDQFIWVRFGVPCGAFESFEFVRGMDAKPLPNLVPSSVPGEASATCLSQRPSWWSVHGWKLWETDGNLLDLWKLEWEDPRSLALTLTSDFNFIILSLFSKISLALKIVHVFFCRVSWRVPFVAVSLQDPLVLGQILCAGCETSSLLWQQFGAPGWGNFQGGISDSNLSMWSWCSRF